MPTQADVYSQRARGLKLRQPLFYLYTMASVIVLVLMALKIV